MPERRRERERGIKIRRESGEREVRERERGEIERGEM